MILVTGGAGFIGANLVLDWFASGDEPVVNLDNLTYAGNLGNLALLARDERHVFVRGDIGDRALVEPLMPKEGPAQERLEVFHATQVVAMDESPALALRKKPDNTISRCWELLAQRKVDAIVSAGNTGAMVAGG